MKVTLSTCKKSFVPAAIALVLFTLTACGELPTDIGLGAAGEPSQTPSENTTEVPAGENPVATAIPAASGHIIFVSNRDGQNNLYMTSPDGTQVEHLTSNISE